jgi:hypothetical protein
MLQPHFSSEGSADAGWEVLQNGLPTVIGFARLCAAALGRLESPQTDVSSLSPEALAILSMARQRGMIELRGNKNAFEPADRLLAVCVELDAGRRLVLKHRGNPRQTLAFLDGFRQLCASGLVLHHLMLDFSLTRAGFDLADGLLPEDYQELIAFAAIEPI